ncbi:hypothetical protein FN846DRAFT_896169 [Sphaerosporella brunnea]|uniref:Uncharacterized protein n=1 Tax=Sphaerosporella brunnea TaxID=1250544 RepID=A0A5J5ECD9_9PEZI|nr:hypothetical protein FN846DRAFT_896169 [Sphaerosporella brunnea]
MATAANVLPQTRFGIRSWRPPSPLSRPALSATISLQPADPFGSIDTTPNIETVPREVMEVSAHNGNSESSLLELYARTFGIQAPPLKFVVPGDDRIYCIPSEELKTYGDRTQDLKMAVADKLQIDIEEVLDMSLDRIQDTEWRMISSRWPYCFGKFTVVGQPMFADPVLTVVWKSKNLAIKCWLPCPRRITVGELLTIVRGYLGQLMDSPLHLPLVPRLTRSELNKIKIEDGAPRDLVSVIRNRGCAKCLQQPTVFVGTNGGMAHSHSAESTEPQMVFVAVQNLWVMMPATSQPRPDLVLPATLTVSEAKAIIEKQFCETLGLEDEEDRAEVLFRHDMLTAAPEGCWDEIADQNATALGTMRMAVRSVLSLISTLTPTVTARHAPSEIQIRMRVLAVLVQAAHHRLHSRYHVPSSILSIRVISQCEPTKCRHTTQDTSNMILAIL